MSYLKKLNGAVNTTLLNLSAMFLFVSTMCNAQDVIEYSLLIEEDGDNFMYISQLDDGTKSGNIILLGGYKWFKKTFNNSQSPRIFIQPENERIPGEQSSYTKTSYEISNFHLKFSEFKNGDQKLHFNSRQAMSVINSFIAKNQRFTFAGLTAESWYAGTFSPVSGVNDLLTLAKNNPDGFCFLLDLPIAKNTRNRQLQISNLSELSKDNGVECDSFNNVVFNGNRTPKLNEKTVPKIVPDGNSDDIYKVASGSGFYVSDQGHIITNHHVIEGCENMKVHSKGNVLETKKIAQDRRNDLALLKTSQTPKHSFALSPESTFPLQEIIVAGYPFGENVSSTLKFTQGIVSSIAGIGDDYSQIQIDAALQPGNSGGPILDEYGNVVAVAVAKLSLKKILKDYGVVPENTNFGIKASAVKNLMEGNGIPLKSPNTEVISKRELSEVATDGTVYLTCWMTTSQIDQMRARKVLFDDLE